MSDDVTIAALRADLPGKRGRKRVEISVTLQVVTPIHGGAVAPREVDEVDVIRPASIRGNLRFWWRALAEIADPEELYRVESELWGGATRKGDSWGRSRVDVRVEVLKRGVVISADDYTGPESYATFPAQAQRGSGIPAAKLRRSVEFRLSLYLHNSPERDAQAVRDALRAWILFGGYGGRTRRGLGCMTVIEEAEQWLPERADTSSIREVFGRDVFAPSEVPTGQTPRLAGAKLFSSQQTGLAQFAWSKAISWLLEFRQGKGVARQQGADGERPGRSHWPEPDKIRHLSLAELPSKLPWAHEPRFNSKPAWPRAELGLPIIGQFQALERRNNGGRPWERSEPPRTEPGEFRIGWQRTGEAQGRDRLASPLILKPLALRSRNFSPIALWLDRAHPPGEVVLLGKDKSPIQGSAAAFGLLNAPGDTIEFDALRGHAELRAAFFAWLRATKTARSTSKSKSKGRGRR